LKDHLNNKEKKLLWENKTMAFLIYLSFSQCAPSTHSKEVWIIKNYEPRVHCEWRWGNTTIKIGERIAAYRYVQRNHTFLHHQSVNSTIRLAHFLLFRYLKAEKCAIGVLFTNILIVDNLCVKFQFILSSYAFFLLNAR
jgi:hypothetical protein